MQAAPGQLTFNFIAKGDLGIRGASSPCCADSHIGGLMPELPDERDVWAAHNIQYYTSRSHANQ